MSRHFAKMNLTITAHHSRDEDDTHFVLDMSCDFERAYRVRCMIHAEDLDMTTLRTPEAVNALVLSILNDLDPFVDRDAHPLTEHVFEVEKL
jgi:hypothetical protein